MRKIADWRLRVEPCLVDFSWTRSDGQLPMVKRTSKSSNPPRRRALQSGVGTGDVLGYKSLSNMEN
jgi:hypothetical protein